jgi:hypothetical protein
LLFSPQKDKRLLTTPLMRPPNISGKLCLQLACGPPEDTDAKDCRLG